MGQWRGCPSARVGSGNLEELGWARWWASPHPKAASVFSHLQGPTDLHCVHLLYHSDAKVGCLHQLLQELSLGRVLAADGRLTELLISHLAGNVGSHQHAHGNAEALPNHFRDELQAIRALVYPLGRGRGSGKLSFRTIRAPFRRSCHNSTQPRLAGRTADSSDQPVSANPFPHTLIQPTS